MSAGFLFGSSCQATQRFELCDHGIPIDWRAYELDELIARLPDVDLEGTWDPEQREWLIHPAVSELETRILSGVVLSDEQWRRALTVSGAIRWREKWPVDEPFAISLRRPGWSGCSLLRVTPRRRGMEPATYSLPGLLICGLEQQFVEEKAFHSDLGTLPLGFHLLELDIVIARGEQRANGSPVGTLWSGTLTVEVVVVPNIDEVMPGKRDEEILAAIRDSIQVRRGDEPWSGSFEFVHDDAQRIALSATAICVEVELLHGGSVVEQHEPERHTRSGMFDHGAPDLPPRIHGYRCLAQLPPPGASLEGWTVRVRGVPERAVRWWGTESRFDGVVEVPLADVLR